jgi:hypothetical protein
MAAVLATLTTLPRRGSLRGPTTDSADISLEPLFRGSKQNNSIADKSLHGNANPDAGTITILRSGGKEADSIASPAASRGS